MSNNKVPELSILAYDQLFGKDKLHLFNAIRKSAFLTDTAIIRGACLSSYDQEDNFKSQTGFYYLKDDNSYGDVCIIDEMGCEDATYCDSRCGGIRLVASYSDVKDLAISCTNTSGGLLKVEYGAFSEDALDMFEQATLNNLYEINKLKPIKFGNVLDASDPNDCSQRFLPSKQLYYERDGQLLARIKINSFFDQIILSNNLEYQKNDVVWTKVKPVVFLKHPEDDLMVSEKIVLSGIMFSKECGEYDGDFSNSELKGYLDNHLSTEMYLANQLIKKMRSSKNGTLQRFVDDDKVKTKSIVRPKRKNRKA